MTIEPAIRASETIQCSHPLYSFFAFYRYYILEEKYKAPVKFNLDHPAYFKKRDKLMELTNDESLRPYWLACLLSFASG